MVLDFPKLTSNDFAPVTLFLEYHFALKSLWGERRGREWGGRGELCVECCKGKAKGKYSAMVSTPVHQLTTN